MNIELIAEIGQNHNGDMSLAKELILQAKKNGADVAKFQVYDAKALFPPSSINPWYEYNCKTELSKENVIQLHDYCNKIGIEFMASVFDLERLNWLEEIGVKRYKVASRSINDSKLIAAITATNKPVIVSLGMWGEYELPEINSTGGVRFMHCVSKYPAPLHELCINKIDFTRINGFSDHSEGITAACAAIVRGCSLIEKHFTYNKNAYGPDHLCSMDSSELERLRKFKDEWIEIIQ